MIFYFLKLTTTKKTFILYINLFKFCFNVSFTFSTFYSYKILLLEAEKYRNIIQNAKNADGIIKTKYEEHKEGVGLLCLSEVDLKRSIPSSSNLTSLIDNPVCIHS